MITIKVRKVGRRRDVVIMGRGWERLLGYWQCSGGVGLRR